MKTWYKRSLRRSAFEAPPPPPPAEIQQHQPQDNRVVNPIDLADTKPWTGIVVHHSASPNWTTVENIDAWHKEKGWSGVGYHFVIESNGAIKKGRPLSDVGAHAKTGKPYSRNTSHIGICLVGEETFTQAQQVALDMLIKKLNEFYNIESVERHHEKCPGSAMDVERYNGLIKKR